MVSKPPDHCATTSDVPVTPPGSPPKAVWTGIPTTWSAILGSGTPQTGPIPRTAGATGPMSAASAPPGSPDSPAAKVTVHDSCVAPPWSFQTVTVAV